MTNFKLRLRKFCIAVKVILDVLFFLPAKFAYVIDKPTEYILP